MDFIYASRDVSGAPDVKQRIRARFIIVVQADTDKDMVACAVSTIINHPPLSKYGISPIIEVLNELNCEDTSLFTYTKTNSHKFLRSIDVSFLPFRKKREVIVSPICVNLNEKDYE